MNWEHFVSGYLSGIATVAMIGAGVVFAYLWHELRDRRY